MALPGKHLWFWKARAQKPPLLPTPTLVPQEGTGLLVMARSTVLSGLTDTSKEVKVVQGMPQKTGPGLVGGACQGLLLIDRTLGMSP